MSKCRIAHRTAADLRQVFSKTRAAQASGLGRQHNTLKCRCYVTGKLSHLRIDTSENNRIRIVALGEESREDAGADLLAVIAALGLKAYVGGVALRVGGVRGHCAAAGQRVGRGRRPPQVPLAGAVLLKVDQTAAGYPAHLHSSTVVPFEIHQQYQADPPVNGGIQPLEGYCLAAQDAYGTSLTSQVNS